MVKKILHITNWHPNRENPYEAIWMRRHVEALDEYLEQEVWHIQVRGGQKWKYHKYTDDNGCHHRVLDIPTQRWFIIELLTAWMLWWTLVFKIRKKDFQGINIHIAYPLLTYWGWCKPFVKLPVIMTEHWSAYHLNFGLPKNTNKLGRIKRIFHRNIPLITVSEALGNDIKSFADAPDIEHYVIPNVVQTTIFNNQSEMPPKPVFFMVSSWAYPKNPNLVIKAFSNILKSIPDARLRIGGYGKLLPEMETLVEDLNLQKQVTFLGKLSPQEIASEQNKASGFIHCSGYETFSVVCVEALCCGTPIIASNVGGIPEFVNDANGLLVMEQSEEAWTNALIKFCAHYQQYDKINIAKTATLRFDARTIGKQYADLLKKLWR